MNIIDTHAHLDMSQFNTDLVEVISRANEAGVNRIITIGIDAKTNYKALKLAESIKGIWAALGIHPQESKGIQKKDIIRMGEMCSNPRVIGIGETGLDFYHEDSPRTDQFRVFEWHLELAQSRGLPVIIHSRQALEDTRSILKSWASNYPLPEGKSRGVIHCFSGDLKTALEYIEMGFYIAIGGYLGYPSSSNLRKTLLDIPLERLVVETDCPFLPPQKFRGKRNEPAYTRMTLGLMAEIKGLSLEQMATQTTLNAEKLFNLSEQSDLRDSE